MSFHAATGGPENAYRNYDGAAIVALAFSLSDWWCERRTRSRTTAAGPARRTRAVPFSLALLAAIDSGIALSADGPAGGLICGGDYVCIPDAASQLHATTRVAPQPAGQGPAGANHVAENGRCVKGAIHVAASSADEQAFACQAAAEAIRLLGDCGITPRWKLQVEIMPEVRHPLGRVVLGLLDTKRKRVLVTRSDKVSALIEETPYAALSPRAFYRSLIVHEVVHAVMDQNLRRAATTHAAYEYPAYALQIESLAPADRELFLSAFEQEAIQSDSLFNDPVLFFNPYLFAARAYHHFKRSPEGCAHLNELLRGDVPFIAALEMR